MSLQRPPTHERGLREDLHHEIERILAPRTCFPNRFGELGELLESGEIDREQPVPSGCAADWPPIGPVCRDPDGNPRALHRERRNAPFQNPLSRSKPSSSRRALAWVDGLSVRSEVVGVAESDAQSETPVAEELGQEPRIRQLVAWEHPAADPPSCAHRSLSFEEHRIIREIKIVTNRHESPIDSDQDLLLTCFLPRPRYAARNTRTSVSPYFAFGLQAILDGSSAA